jgi:hypothetical protein
MRRRRMIRTARAGIALVIAATIASGTVGVAGAVPAVADASVMSFTSTPAPTLYSNPQAGYWAIAQAGQFVPTPDQLTYTWYLGGAETSCAGDSCDLPVDSMGEQVSVAVTATKAGYQPVTETSESETVVGHIAAPEFSLAGIPKPGNTLALTQQGSWSPASGLSISYQWIRLTSSGDIPIAGASSDSYSVQDSDSGNTIALEVTAAEPGYLTAVAYSPSIVADYDTVQTTAPIIYGLAAVGQPLTAFVNGWLPAPAHYQYQWQRDGVDIPGATSAGYTVQQADVGESLTVAAGGTPTGFGFTTTTSAPTAIVPTQFDRSPTPIISGPAQLGERMSADISSWSPTPSDVSYSWSITGQSGTVYTATGPTFTVTNPDVIGERATVTVDADDANRGHITETSAPSAPITEGSVNLSHIRLDAIHLNAPIYFTGFPTVYDAPIVDTWSVDGTGRIANIDTGTYTPEGEDYGKKVQVTIQVRGGNGWKPSEVTLSGTVGTGIFSIGHTTDSGTAKVGQSLSVSSYGWGPTGVKVSYAWFSSNPADGGPIAYGTSYRLKPSDLGYRIVGMSTGSMPHFANPGWWGPDPILVGKGVFATVPTLTVAGMPAVGALLTVSRTAASPSSGVAYAYQWYSQATKDAPAIAIPHATGASMLVPASLAGHLITVRLTVKKSDYTTAIATSAATRSVLGFLPHPIVPARHEERPSR